MLVRLGQKEENPTHTALQSVHFFDYIPDSDLLPLVVKVGILFWQSVGELFEGPRGVGD